MLVKLRRPLPSWYERLLVRLRGPVSETPDADRLIRQALKGVCGE